MSAAANDAIAYLLRRIKDDPHLAYYFGFTESLERLTKAHAVATGVEPVSFHRDFQAALQARPPRCRSGECHKDREAQ